MNRLPAIIVLGASALGVGLFAAAAFFGGFRLNLTPSEALGLWRIETPQRAIAAGNLVFICPPQTPPFEEARHRLYLARGLCPGGFAPLIKAVAALPGQYIEIGQGVSIDGMPLPSSAVRRTDGAGRPLKPCAGGLVPPGYLYVHSPFVSSYDSRYFGPIPDSGLLGLARPILRQAVAAYAPHSSSHWRSSSVQLAGAASCLLCRSRCSFPRSGRSRHRAASPFWSRRGISSPPHAACRTVLRTSTPPISGPASCFGWLPPHRSSSCMRRSGRGVRERPNLKQDDRRGISRR